jgi:hypothetical protein
VRPHLSLPTLPALWFYVPAPERAVLFAAAPADAGCARLRLDVRLVGSAASAARDLSGRGHRVSVLGGAQIDETGAVFDGEDDTITIAHFDYAYTPDFSVGFWMTKQSCAGHIYEYLYSHNALRTSEIDDTTNSNVNMYMGCESSGGGWSSVTGSVIRFNLIDTAGGLGLFDYPVHDAGEFDAVTNVWLHIVLVVDTSVVKTYSEGRPVQDSEYGFYIGGTAAENAAANLQNLAYPYPGALKRPGFSGFGMQEDIYVGARGDQDPGRFFEGRMAGLVVADSPLTGGQVSCLFAAGERYLPEIQYSCDAIQPSELSVTLLSTADPPTDDSGNGHRITNHGGVMTSSGASFSLGSYLTVEPFDYASDSTFSVSMWVAKEQCAEETHEYLYSHMEQQTGTWDTDSYALMMFLCEETGAFASTVDGSVLRYDIHDTAGQRGTFDFSVHEAGDFDAITSRWLHVIWTVSPTAMASFVDGAPAVVDQYGFFTGLTEGQNIARPHPDQLEPALGALNLQTDIYLGGRFDGDAARAFRGNLALVNIYGRVVTADEAACIFHDGDALLSLGFLSGGRRSLSAAWAVNKTSL